MFLRQTIKPKGTYLAIVENIYDSSLKKNRQRTIEGIGYLEDLKAQYDDPVAFFSKKAAYMSIEKKALSTATVTIDRNAILDEQEDNLLNVGYVVLKLLYKDLELDKFWNWKTRNRSIQFSMDKIFRLLTFSRVLFPASKKETFENRGIYFESFDGFSLDDVYHSLDILADNQEALQKWIYERSGKICARDLSVSYFDCTNYYFDIGRSDMDTLDDDGNPIDKKGNPTSAKYRKRGPEKNHRPDPIVEMGLLMDRNGIPLAFELFPGNESEKVHMRPILNRVKKDFGDTRTIIVADRGLNTSDNIYFINGDNKGDNNQRDGYVYGQSVRGASAEFKAWVLSGGYTDTKVRDEDGNEITFTHKSRIHPKELHVNVTVPGQKKKKKKTVKADQKQMVYYSEKYAKKQRMDRQVMVERAKDLVKHPKKYDKITAAGSAAYVKDIVFDKETGEIVEEHSLELNIEKIEEEAKYDGYYSIVTSELKMNDLEIRDIYRGLARIEETFMISKSDFDARPVHVRTNDHIDAHFTTCFVALILIRLLQAKLGHRYPVGKILESLRKYNCTSLDVNLYQFVYYNEILKACGQEFNLDLSAKYRTRQQIQRLLKY